MRLKTPRTNLHENYQSDRHNHDANVFESRHTLDDAAVSFAEVLPRVYSSARFGKWQLGPNDQGFDYVSDSGRTGNSDKTSLFYGDVHVADSLTAMSIDFILSRHDQPFLLYLAHWDVHQPTRAKKEREAAAKSHLGTVPQPLPWQCSSAYGGMITALDDSINRIQTAVDGLGIANRTMIIFSSDNGGVRCIACSCPSLRACALGFIPVYVRVSTSGFGTFKEHATASLLIFCRLQGSQTTALCVTAKVLCSKEGSVSQCFYTGRLSSSRTNVLSMSQS